MLLKKAGIKHSLDTTSRLQHAERPFHFPFVPQTSISTSAEKVKQSIIKADNNSLSHAVEMQPCGRRANKRHSRIILYHKKMLIFVLLYKQTDYIPI